MHVTKVHDGSFDQDTDTEPKNVNNPDYLLDFFFNLLFKSVWVSKTTPRNKIKLKTFVTSLVMSHALYLQRWNVIVRDQVKAGHVRAKTFITAWVCRAGDS